MAAPAPPRRFGLPLLLVAFVAGYLVGQSGEAAHLARRVRGLLPGAGAGSPPPTRSGELWLADFETEHELSEWQADSVVATLASEHATHGQRAARITFEPAEGSARFALESALERDPRLSDWRGYGALRFSLHNAGESRLRVLLQMKDARGRLYKEEVRVAPRATEEVEVRLEALPGYLDLGRIAEFEVFRWDGKERATFFLDAVRLTPGPRAASAAESGRPLPPADSWTVGWTTTLNKVFPDGEAFRGKDGPVALSLAPGESEGVQIVVRGARGGPSRVAARVGELSRAGGGGTVAAADVQLRSVGYVETVPPYYPVTRVGLWPDPLPASQTIDVPAGEIRAFWMTVRAREGLPVGRYQGTVTLEGEGQRREVPVVVTVRGFSLPRQGHLRTAFDFYRSRLERAYRESVPGGEVWTGRIEELERLYFHAMLEYRLSPIWGADPSKPSFPATLRELRDRGLTAFSLLPRGGSNGNNWPHDPEALSRLLPRYHAAADRLAALDALDLQYVYAYDEPKPGTPHASQVLAALHRADPRLRTLLAMHQPPEAERDREWMKDADIVCIRNAVFDPRVADALREQGKEIWLYVSSPAPPFPTLVIDSPALAARILPWMCWKYGVKGLLFWCVNFWKGDPWKRTANFADDQNGNGSLFYPVAEGPVPSIRVEVLRDGLEDYEYLHRLGELVIQARGRAGFEPALLQRAQRLLEVDPELVASMRTYSHDPEVLLAQRAAVGDTIEAMQAALGPAPREGR
jgi:glycosyl hydrolase family 123